MAYGKTEQKTFVWRFQIFKVDNYTLTIRKTHREPFELKKWGQKTSPFPKLTLANEQGIIYNQFRDSYRICACPMIVTGNL